jgi:hypothetical protein
MNVNDVNWKSRCDCLLKLNQFWGVMKKGNACTVSYDMI